MQNMMLIGQILSKQFVILFLANMNERNLFRQKAKTFEFVHNRLNAGLGRRIRITLPGGTSVSEFCSSRCPGHFPEFGTSQTMRSEDSTGIRWLNSGSGDVVYVGSEL